MRALVLSALVVLSLAGTAPAQDRAQTLADIRAELVKLASDIVTLKSELAASDNQGGTIDGSVLDRVSAIDAEVARLTAKTEELDIRINRIIADGTNRLGDLEYRVVEMEGGDPNALETTKVLGGGAAPATVGQLPAPTPPDGPVGGPELAVGEQADFDAAKAKMDGGDAQGAADAFLSFTQTYPGSPLAADALLLRGDALTGLGQVKDAARAYLDAFTANQTGAKAPVALLKLGNALQAIGQVPDACLMYREVGNRFPAAPETAQAQAAMTSLACG